MICSLNILINHPVSEATPNSKITGPKCAIKPCMQNKMFDHRAVEICFKDPPKVIKQPTVSREILSDPDIELYVG
jgi:hypothetical protein